MSSHPSHRDSDVRRGHAQEADGSQASARAPIPSSSSATPDVRAPRPRQGTRGKASSATTPTPCAAAPSAGVSSAPPTPSVCSNLSTPLKKSGQVASPGTPTRFNIECLRDLLDLLRKLHEQAQGDVQAPTQTPALDGHHGADRAGNPAAPGPLGPSGGDRQAQGINSDGSTRPEP
jgi:hypothetical protein